MSPQQPLEDRRALRQDNLRMVGKLAVVAGLMFGFGYALVPMYRAICDALGITVLSVAEHKRSGLAGGTAANTQVDKSRTITVEFDANSQGPWRFRPHVNHLQVHPGELVHVTVRDTGPDDAIRLDVRRAFAALGDDGIAFHDQRILPGQAHRLAAADFIDGIGDVVLARRGMGTSYHLSVVVDDAAQGISLVTRGKDLFDSTHIHVLLQRLLGLPTPAYHHHRLIRDDAGKRLAKRDDARAIASYRAAGLTPQDVRQLIGL